jgi:Tfp pilus assembly protein PilF
MRLFPALSTFVISFFSLWPSPAAGETFLVLPFFNHTTQSNLDWIGESIAENVRDALAAEGALTISRDDRLEAYRRLTIRPLSLLTKASVLKIAETVDADRVIYGHFELRKEETGPVSRGTLKISAEILDLHKVRKGPDFMAVGALEDLAALQNHISWQTLQFVMPETAPSEEEFRKSRPPLRVDALEYYIRGLTAVNEEQRIQLFSQAIRIDPRYSQAAFELGKLYWEKDNYKAAAESLEKVSPLDSRHREALFYLGSSRFYLKDYAGAQKALSAVVQEVPLNEVWNNLGAVQSRRNDLASATESFEKALEGDASDPDYHFNLGYVQWKAGNFEKAAASFRAAVERDPDDKEATTMLGRCLKNSGPRPGETREGLERLKYEYAESAYLQLRSILQSGKKP